LALVLEEEEETHAVKQNRFETYTETHKRTHTTDRKTSLVAPRWPKYGLNAHPLLIAHLLDCSDVNKDFQPAEPTPSRRSWLLKPRYDLASKNKANLGQYQGQDSFPYGEFKDKVTDLDCKAETKAKD